MATRLTVVVSQSSGQTHQAKDLEEALLAELMMAPGLDATMIGPLEKITQRDTDYLCLSSFQHSFVIVSALELKELKVHWERLQLAGDVIPVDRRVSDSSLALANGATKRVYHMPLRPGNTIAEVMSRIGEIRQDRSVQTVSIGILGVAAESKLPVTANLQFAEKGRGNSEVPRYGKLDASGADVQADSSELQAKPSRRRISQETESPSTAAGQAQAADESPDEDLRWGHLDRLVDDLDALDL